MKPFALILACAAWGLSAGLLRAAELEFDINPRVLRLGEYATCSFTLTGANNPKRPSFKPKEGWQITYTGTQQSFAASPAGMISTITYQYRLLPLRIGKSTFGPVPYQLDGVAGETGEIQVEVIARKQADDGGSGDLTNFIMAKVDTVSTNVYLQQVFDLTLSVYYRDLRLSSDMRLLEIQETGLKLSAFKAIPSQREMIEGEMYTVQRFRASARAISEGSFTFEPVIRVNIVKEPTRRNRFNPLFEQLNLRNTQPFDVTAEALTIKVNPLPEQGKPDHFAGAVGNFNFDVAVRPTRLKVGDPITVTTKLSGTGNMDFVLAPHLVLDKRFKSYEAKMLENDLNQSETAGKRIFEQVIIPESHEIAELPELLFSYFDPRKEKYITLRRGPYPLKIAVVENEQRHTVGGTEDQPSTRKKLLDQDILYLKETPRGWQQADMVAWYAKPSFLALQGIPPLALVVCFIAGRRRKTLESDVAKARRHQAPKHARAAVRKAQQAMQSNDAPAFFAALWEGLSSYFSNRLNIGPGEVSLDVVNSAMIERGMNPERLEELSRLFDTVDAQRYGGSSELDPGGMKDLLNQMTGLLKHCERLK